MIGAARLLAIAGVLAAIATADGARALSPLERAEQTLARMTQNEKLTLVRGVLGAPWGGQSKPAAAVGSAGYVPGIPRLGIPPLQETDGELGVANPGNIRRGDRATAMPSDLALAATFDLDLARAQGEAVGEEARARGFNVVLGGAANLIRDPRGGRDFEYFSEDPLLTGLMAGAAIAGVQSRHVISTIKHFALNDQETDRVVLDVRIDPSAARESDLLAFEIGIERGRPGSVMCAYNQVNGIYSCQNDWLLNEVLKRDWGYPGFVMSDWGAVHSTVGAALAGLDQESGDQLDTENFFDRLGQAIAEGRVPQQRLDDMVRRILTSVFAHGLDDATTSDLAETGASDRTALAIELSGAVLLKNDGTLPLPASIRRVVVIGAHVDRGVPSGGGSSQVVPRGGFAFLEPLGENQAMIFDPSSPLDALRRQFPLAGVDFDDGRFPERAAKAASQADAAIVFADQWRTETADVQSLSLPFGQDRLIEGVTRANPHTIVVLETGGPVLMPWADRVAAILEAWYPGQEGARAIAQILSGSVNPSGRLPVTFPQSEAQLAHPKIPGDPKRAPIGPVGRGGHYGRNFVADYRDGAEVGYKWFFDRGEKPLFPFGFGLSYTHFALSGFRASLEGVNATLYANVANLGARGGAATAEFYVSGPSGSNVSLRLAGWSRIELGPGETRAVRITVDPRLLATFEEPARRWRIHGGEYRLSAGFDSERRQEGATLFVPEADLPP
ncbi:MAG: glycoside hydrolase family 3 protein [Hyphomicrobiales bacterium]|nr:glycoside hydrolase family 3 protein [Hyphomicrobiales bacterium]